MENLRKNTIDIKFGAKNPLGLCKTEEESWNLVTRAKISQSEERQKRKTGRKDWH